jgi:hypothetical protein
MDSLLISLGCCEPFCKVYDLLVPRTGTLKAGFVVGSEETLAAGCFKYH